MNVLGGVPINDRTITYDSAMVPSDMVGKLSEETHAILKTYFAEEIGTNVEHVILTVHPIQLEIPAKIASTTINLNGFHRCLQNISKENLALFVQKATLSLLRFDLDDGKRFAVVHTYPSACPTRVILDPEQGVCIEILFRELERPCTVYVNLCIADPVVCFNCGETKGEMIPCLRCEKVAVNTQYCSRACQAAHWAAHRPFCGDR